MMNHGFEEVGLPDEAVAGLIVEIRAARVPKSPDTLALLSAVENKLRQKRRLMGAEKRKIESIYSFMCR